MRNVCQRHHRVVADWSLPGAVAICAFHPVRIGLVLLLIAVLARPQRGLLRALQVLMIVTAIAGGIGTIVHLRGNLELAQEVKPAQAQAQPLWMALTGHNPPLAPGALGITALIALAATYRHPALQKSTSESRVVMNNQA